MESVRSKSQSECRYGKNIRSWLGKLLDNGEPKQEYPDLFSLMINTYLQSRRNFNDSETVRVTESLVELTADENPKDSVLWRIIEDGLILYSSAIGVTEE